MNNEFRFLLFPTKKLKELPTPKKVRAYATRFDYEIDVNPERLNMKMTIKGFKESDLDFRVSYSPVRWGKQEWPENPTSRWYVFEYNSNTMAYAGNEMESSITNFLYLLGNSGKKSILNKLRSNKLKLKELEENSKENAVESKD
jgi:hypothetical protein